MRTYSAILHQRSKDKWKNITDSKITDEVLALTHCHSYYVNAVCRALWKSNTKPTIAMVQQTWLQYVDDQKPWILDDIARLTPHQKSVLARIAYTKISKPCSNDFQRISKLPTYQIKRSLEGLLREDIVYKDNDNNFCVLDPAIETCIREITRSGFCDA